MRFPYYKYLVSKKRILSPWDSPEITRERLGEDIQEYYKFIDNKYYSLAGICIYWEIQQKVIVILNLVRL